MASDHGSVPVIDFRRQSMILQWHVSGGTWTAYDVPPQRVHGVALIRAAPPNICLYGEDGHLCLQIGRRRFTLESSLRIGCRRELASLGLRRRFTIESAGGGVLFSHAYWPSRGEDFFAWVAARTRNPEWRAAAGRRWSEGLSAPELRST